MSRKQKVGECVYCGSIRPLTDDHVFPKCLFPATPSDSVIVRACAICNNDAKSQDDTYLRDFLVADGYAAQSPVAQAIVTGKLSRSFQKHHSLFAKTIAAEGKLASLHTPAGVYLGEFLKAPLDAERVTRILRTHCSGTVLRCSGQANSE